MEIPLFSTRKELLDFLFLNKEKIAASKKGQIKHTDVLTYKSVSFIEKKEETQKANKPVESPPDELKVKVVINTTNLMDSHLDVHLPGIWNKTLKENKTIFHLREHRMGFESIISDGSDLKASTENYTWKELGFKYEGTTQALVFESNVRKARNPFMHEQYAKGYVRNHSVGMRYVEIALCVNSEEERFKEEKKAWDKYYAYVANKDMADEYGYFWAVKSAQMIEGSAVVVGSNAATPTIDNNMNESKTEVDTTESEAVDTNTSKDQPGKKKAIDYDRIIKHFNN